MNIKELYDYMNKELNEQKNILNEIKGNLKKIDTTLYGNEKLIGLCEDNRKIKEKLYKIEPVVEDYKNKKGFINNIVYLISLLALIFTLINSWTSYQAYNIKGEIKSIIEKTIINKEVKK